MTRPEVYWRHALVWGAIVLGSYVFWRWLVWYVMPFALAILLALLVNPWVARLRRWGLSASLAALVALTASIGGLTALCGAVFSVLLAELLQVSRRLPHYFRERPLRLEQYVQEWNAFRVELGLGSGRVNQELGSVYRLMMRMARDLSHVLVQLPELALVLLVCALASFFLLRDHELVKVEVLRLAPPGVSGRIGLLSAFITRGLVGYMCAELSLVALTGLATMSGLVLIRAPYAGLVGLAAGLLDMVPFMGPTIVLLPWALGAALTGHLGLAFRLVAVLAGVGVIRQTAEPRLVGQSTGLHPLVVLFSLYTGVRLFGAGGVLIGPVTAVLFKAIAQVMAYPANVPPTSG